MTQSAGAISDLIAVPKGGGAQKGLGEKFSADLHTGTGNFTVPIALPAGRNGLHPDLSLGFSTGSGNSPFGLGWALNVPGVSRLTAKGIPRYRDALTDEQDTFVLSGSEDLVAMAATTEDQTAGIMRYRPRTEGLFAQITHHTLNTDHWEVRTKDGLTSVYGTPGLHPENVNQDERSVIADPDNRRKIFAWRLSQTVDPFGNRIVYEYQRDNAQDGGHNGEQLYLRRIRYVDYGTNANDFLISVEFLYNDDPDAPGIEPESAKKARRPDPFSDYRAGFEIRTRRRCKWIVVRTHPTPDDEILVRAYELTYLDEQVTDSAQLPINGVSLLSRINVVGYPDGDAAHGVRELPPLDFEYSRFTPETRKFIPLQGRQLPPTSLSNPDLELVDLFGHGLPDIIELGGTVRYWRNLGNGRFDVPRAFAAVPATWKLSEAGVQLLDANGDGRADLLVTTGETAGYYPLDFRAEFSRKSYQPYAQAPSFSLEDPEVRLVDLTGDGVSDALRSGTSFECYFNHPTEGWSPKRTTRSTREGLDTFPNVSFADPRVKFADLSGDGLQDIALIYQGRIDYWPNLGYGRWGKRIVTQIPGGLPADFDPERVLLGDIDGDGLADLLYISDREVTLWINRTGNAWSESRTIRGTPAVNNMVAVRLTDLLGTGVPGVLWTRDADGSGRPQHFFLDLTGGQKPYLLNRMENNLGAVTEVSYAPSTQFYLRDQAASNPNLHWRSTLPFPVQVVERVIVKDELSEGSLTTEYRYHHGYWDGVEREFRGFGMVEQIDTEVFSGYLGRGLKADNEALTRLLNQQSYSPPLLTRTWFHQGPVDPPNGGQWQEFDGSAEYWPGDRNLLDHAKGINNFLEALGEDFLRARRDAMRALRGSVLRSELYALDGSPRQEWPYTITEQAYGLREESAAPGGQRVFFPYAIASRTTQWERGDDPMTQLAFTDQHDDFGQAQWQLSVACPRGWRKMDDAPAEPCLATINTTVFAEPDSNGPYIRDRVARTRTYEVTQTAGQPIGVLRSINETSSHQRRLIAETATYYDGNSYVGLEWGKLGSFGVAVRAKTLVLTDDILDKAYPQGKPTYFDPSRAFGGGSPYPPAFVDVIQSMPKNIGYAYNDGVKEPRLSTGWFVETQRSKFDFQEPVSDGKGRGLICSQMDPLSNVTRIDDYQFDLLPIQTTGPTGLTIRAHYNLRVMQPLKVTDPNENVTEVNYSPSGFVTDTFVRGKPDAAHYDRRNVGDRQAPSVHMEYGLRAFYESRHKNPLHPQPAYVRAIRRVFHDTDPEDTGETIETREYSDGFERLLQTRTQSESVRFGDARFGGGDSVLPVDQASPSNNVIVGVENESVDAQNVVVSGWQRYDNKGRVVEKFEPYFDQGWHYIAPDEEAKGQSVTLFYDARGQTVRTVNPDRSEQRVIHGKPFSLDDPPLSPLDIAKFQPTPWEAYIYDANDNAGRTHRGQAPHTSYQHHYDTPASITVDAMGRTVRAVARHRNPFLSDGSLPAIEEHATRSIYDIQGNLLGIRDALGRLAFEYVYDLAKQPLRTESIDAGRKQTVLDAAGNVIETRDAKGALVLHAYDAINRPIHVWARDAAIDDVTLRQKIRYDSDPGASGEDVIRNLRGKLVQHHDEAGVVTIGEYDFKSNLLSSTRQVLSDAFMLSNFKPEVDGTTWKLKAPRVDWTASTDVTLDAAVYETRSAFDALSRVKWSEYPKCANGERYRLRPDYNRAGALERVDLVGPLASDDVGIAQSYVNRVAYNAKGQRTLIVYGNGLIKRYAYDTATYRLARLRTDRLDPNPLDSPGSMAFKPRGAPLQDIAYSYDLAGNILGMLDRTPGCGVVNNPDAIFYRGPLGKLLSKGDALLRCFEYDPLYRLVSATGREGKSIPSPRPRSDDRREGYNSGNHGTPNQDNAPNVTSLYWEEYAFDAAGNMLTLRHNKNEQRDGAVGWNLAWSRRFGMGGRSPQQWQIESTHHIAGDWVAPPTNCLTHVQVRTSGVATPSTVLQSHFYDDSGNMVSEQTERHFEWDYADRMKVFRNQTGRARPTVYALYLYDAGGQRVKKLVVAGNGYRTTNYLGSVFEHHAEYDMLHGSGKVENCSLHVKDDRNRVAIVRVGLAFADDGTVAHPVRYDLGDHLGSCSVVVAGSGEWINREEYFPFGESSFGSYGRKRYRFTGMERDEESGLAYHRARYYMMSLGRWISCDPANAADGLNLFAYVNGNPWRRLDLTGLAGEDAGMVQPMEPQRQEPGTHIVVVGTDFIGMHNNSKNFPNAAVRFMSGETDEKFRERVAPGDNIVVIVPKEMTSVPGDPTKDLKAALADLRQLFAKFEVSVDAKGEEWVDLGNHPTTEYVVAVGKDVAPKVSTYKNIKTIAYFGHGGGSPLYDSTDFGEAKDFSKASFNSAPLALFCTCNASDYAKQFTSHIGGVSMGVEGTTFFGASGTVSAGKKNGGIEPARGWQFEMTDAGTVRSMPFNLTQKPFLKISKPAAPAVEVAPLR